MIRYRYAIVELNIAFKLKYVELSQRTMNDTIMMGEILFKCLKTL